MIPMGAAPLNGWNCPADMAPEWDLSVGFQDH